MHDLAGGEYSDMKQVVSTLVERCEEAVKLLCENSQAPHDDCDRVAQRLGCAADAAAAKLMSIDDRIAKLEAELSWYGEQTRLCRLIHSEGDAGRHALAADGGKRARQVLQK